MRTRLLGDQHNLNLSARNGPNGFSRLVISRPERVNALSWSKLVVFVDAIRSECMRDGNITEVKLSENAVMHPNDMLNGTQSTNKKQNT